MSRDLIWGGQPHVACLLVPILPRDNLEKQRPRGRGVQEPGSTPSVVVSGPGRCLQAGLVQMPGKGGENKEMKL